MKAIRGERETHYSSWKIFACTDITLSTACMVLAAMQVSFSSQAEPEMIKCHLMTD
jgi:hypothetical protein